MRILAYLLVAVTLSACETPVEPLPRPPGAVPMEPVPEVYPEWYESLEECSGLKGNFAGLKLYVVPGVSAWEHPKYGPVGAIFRSPNKIFVAEYRKHRWGTVAHEFGHHLLWIDRGLHDHPSPPFGECFPE